MIKTEESKLLILYKTQISLQSRGALSYEKYFLSEFQIGSEVERSECPGKSGQVKPRGQA